MTTKEKPWNQKFVFSPLTASAGLHLDVHGSMFLVEPGGSWWNFWSSGLHLADKGLVDSSVWAPGGRLAEDPRGRVGRLPLLRHLLPPQLPPCDWQLQRWMVPSAKPPLVLCWECTFVSEQGEIQWWVVCQPTRVFGVNKESRLLIGWRFFGIGGGEGVSN